MTEQNKLEQLSINTIRFLAVDGVEKAKCGHPGMPMACAPIAYLLYTKLMKHNPANPKWLNRDRFVLSAGHGSMLLYSILHLSGYKVSIDDLKNFRQWGSITPGHPEFGLTPGVETTTGPLGQGIANAIGMAIAQEYIGSIFNKDDIKILDHYIYGICSDGDMMEGVSHEAASLAGHLKLNKIIFFYDDNGITIDGKTSLAFSENIGKRFEAYGWNIEHITDVNDLSQIEKALKNAQKSDKPNLIVTKTVIGYGSPNKAGTSSIHGAAMGAEEAVLTKKNLGWDPEKFFYVPDEVAKYFNDKKVELAKYEADWNKLFETYKAKYPKEAEQFVKMMKGEIGEEWKSKLPAFIDEDKKISTRIASEKVLNAISESLPSLIGGSADLAPSNNTYIKGKSAFTATDRSGKNFHFGVREHGMASILNGMAMYGGLIPYGGTFFVFSDYLRPAIRLASISKVKPVYVFTHDSIGLGEDGPTHQPVEQLAALRAIPGVIDIRPADANETVFAWKYAVESKGAPVALLLTRQGIPVLDQTKYAKAENLVKGAYTLKDSKGKPDVILIATGSEVSLAIKAYEQLESEGIKTRIVSFPSRALFEKQSDEYKNSVLPKDVKARVVIEAGVSFGWEKYAGDNGKIIGMKTFGASAPENILFEKYGFTKDNIVKTAKEVLAK